MDDQVKRWLADELPPEMLLTPLPDEVAMEVVERLEKEFEQYWYIDSNRSLTYADRIIAIGSARK